MQTATKKYNEVIISDYEFANMTEGAALGSLNVAEKFYPAKSTEEAASPAPLVTSDKDGLINVILLSEQVSDSLQTLLNEQKQNLINLTGLATAYVSRQAEKDPNKKYDVQLWQKVFSKLPLMGPSKFTKQTFSKRVKGVTIAKEFMDFILNSIVEKRPAMDDFRKFIENQGKSITIGTARNADGFQMGSICIVLETMQIGNEIQLVPKLKAYFVKFERKNFNFAGACAKYEEVDINFSYETAVGVFNYKALENPEVKAKFDALIGKAQIEDITQSTSFFSDSQEDQDKAHKEKLSNAESFFPDMTYQESVLDWDSLDKEKRIKIIQSEPQGVTGNLQNILQKQKQYLLDLVGVAAGYIQKQSFLNPLAIYDVKLWEDALSKLPLMNSFKFSQLNLTYQITPAIASALISQGYGILGGSISLLIEAQKVGSQIDLLPKMKTSFLFLEKEEVEKLISVFRTGQETNITFKCYQGTSLLNYKILETDRAIAEKFEAFLNRVSKTNVTTWNTFFQEKYNIAQLLQKEIQKIIEQKAQEGSESPDNIDRLLVNSKIADEVLAQLSNGLVTSTGISSTSSLPSQVEAIVLNVGRPVLLINENSFSSKLSDFWQKDLEKARKTIESAIKAVGRIEVRNHPTYNWIGTAWLVAPDVLVTNRHVANEFAIKHGSKFVFRTNEERATMRASINFKVEYDNPSAAEFSVIDILYIENENNGYDNGSINPDLAFLKVSRTGDSNSPLSEPIPLSKDLVNKDRKVVVIGYPARDSRNDSAVMDRMFKGIYGVKRLHPGQILSAENSLITHDCSTLGGNSGSVVLDIETGEAVGLHFGGSYLKANYAVPSSIIKDRLDKLS